MQQFLSGIDQEFAVVDKPQHRGSESDVHVIRSPLEELGSRKLREAIDQPLQGLVRRPRETHGGDPLRLTRRLAANAIWTTGAIRQPLDARVSHFRGLAVHRSSLSWSICYRLEGNNHHADSKGFIRAEVVGRAAGRNGAQRGHTSFVPEPHVPRGHTPFLDRGNGDTPFYRESCRGRSIFPGGPEDCEGLHDLGAFRGGEAVSGTRRGTQHPRTASTHRRYSPLIWRAWTIAGCFVP